MVLIGWKIGSDRFEDGGLDLGFFARHVVVYVTINLLLCQGVRMFLVGCDDFPERESLVPDI